MIDNKYKTEKTIEVADDMNILDAAMEAGILMLNLSRIISLSVLWLLSDLSPFCLTFSAGMTADYSCKGGLCNTCAGHIEAGTVDQS